MSVVEVCPICDIAGCRHIRERATSNPTRDEVKALTDLQRVQRMQEANWTPANEYWRGRAKEAEAALTEARAREAAAWEAGRDAAARAVHAFARALNWHPSNVTDCVASILRLTPPPDAAAALTARLDAARDEGWNAAIDAMEASLFEPEASEVRALRREKEG